MKSILIYQKPVNEFKYFAENEENFKPVLQTIPFLPGTRQIVTAKIIWLLKKTECTHVHVHTYNYRSKCSRHLKEVVHIVKDL